MPLMLNSRRSGKRWAEGEYQLQIQRERKKVNHREKEGFPVPFQRIWLVFLITSFHPPPPLHYPFGRYEGRSSHCALNIHSAQIKTHTRTPDAVVAWGKADVRPPTVSSVYDWASSSSTCRLFLLWWWWCGTLTLCTGLNYIPILGSMTTTRET